MLTLVILAYLAPGIVLVWRSAPATCDQIIAADQEISVPGFVIAGIATMLIWPAALVMERHHD